MYDANRMESRFFMDIKIRSRLSFRLQRIETFVESHPPDSGHENHSLQEIFRVTPDLNNLTRRLARLFPVLAVLVAIAIGNATPAQARYASIVVDFETGRVLSEQGADERRHPASLTKMMTLFLIFEALDAGKITLNTRWNVSEYAAGQAPTKLNLQAGDRVAVRDIILGMVTRSANDAAMVAAEGLGGSEARFADMMNRRARDIGMTRTNFENPHGLPNDAQITTVRDMATLGREIIKRYPHHYTFFSTQQFTFEGRKYANHNRLMNWYQGADGIKTGYIRASGFNLVASAVRDGRRIVAAVIGGPNPSERDQYTGKLLDAGFGRGDLPPATTRVAQAPAAEKARNAAPARAQATSAAPSNTPARRANPPQRAQQTSAVEHADKPEEWGVQVGAFAKIDAARRAASAAQKIAPTYLGDATVDISEAGKRYRARLLGITQAQAREACRALDKRDMDCMTLGPAQSRPSTRLADANSRRK
jgi:D-alanyl-D-alanine carboxypeptidase